MKSLLFISIGLLLNIKDGGFYILIPISDILVVIFLTCFDFIRSSSEQPMKTDGLVDPFAAETTGWLWHLS